MTSNNHVRSVLIDGALALHGTPSAWDARASVHPCQGAKYHSPSPLITRKYMTGPHAAVRDLQEPDVWLCATCTENLNCFLHLVQAEPMLDWPTLREFGNAIRELGQRILARQAGV